ncbi:hypothetical protein [Aquimarina spongiae]|uniref:Uncharacterized protein n=1 Tax=Aquimarina spongiae TaxID=570521 RepID=A0A1M6J3K3_9FLAO|nr:hypothetical protein [Aquimarina spongiae]SHJ41131.1 hypothetical protein SAMN04488508_108219 [Aquimarina spongiae]
MKKTLTNTASEKRKVTQKELIQLMAGLVKKEELHPKAQKEKHSRLQKRIAVREVKNNTMHPNIAKRENTKINDLSEDRLKEKRLLEKFIKLNSELPYNAQKTVNNGKEVKKQTLLKKTKKKIQKLKPNKGFGIS